jgi:predicted dehydrogenase
VPKTLNLGILGAGAVFRNMHLPAIIDHGKKFRISALFDPDIKAVKMSKKLLRNTDYNTNYANNPGKIFHDGSIDAIAVLTPTSSHVKYTIDSLKNGKHVFLEKPAGVNGTEIKKVILAQKKYRKIVQVGMVLRHSSFYNELMKIIGSGKYGKVLWMNWIETRPFDPMIWRYENSAKNGDAIIHDKAVHQVNLFNAFADSKPGYVSAFGGQYVISNISYSRVKAFSSEVKLKGDSNDHLLAMINYKNGVKASLMVSYVSPHARESRWIIQLEKARIAAHFETFVNKEKNSRRKWKGNPSAIYLFADKKHLTLPWKYSMSYPPSEKNLVFYDEYPGEPMHPGSAAQWLSFYDSVVNNTKPICGIDLAYNDSIILDAITKSIKQFKTIRL